MSARDPGLVWFRFHSRDFLDGVKALGPADRGNYTTVLSLIYDGGGRVSDDDQWLARQCNCSTRAWRKSRQTLIATGKLVAHDGYLTNPRADREIRHAATLREVRREAGHVGGIRSGNARKKPHNGQDEASPFNNLTEPNASQEADCSDTDPVTPDCGKNGEKFAKNSRVLGATIERNQAPNRSRDSESKRRKKERDSPLCPPKGGRKRERKDFLPKDWQPTEAAFDLGESLGLSRERVEDAAEQMRCRVAHTLERGADWDARFDGWLRGAARLGAQHRASPRRGSLSPEWVEAFLKGDDPVECAA